MKNLHQKTARGIIWSSFDSIGAGAITMILTMILARLLSPSDFGTIELVMIFSSISEIFVDSGFSQSLIREHEVTDLDFSTVFWINLIIAIVLYLILFLLSGFIADYFNIAIFKSLSKVMFLTIIFNSLTLVQNTRLIRELKFNSLAKANIFSSIIAGLISVSLAFLRFGIWALAANYFFASLFRVIFLWVMSKWVPLAKFSLSSAKRHFRFGMNLMLFYLLDKIATNFESFIIGKIYTKSELGYFSQARKLDSYIIQTETKVVQRVTYPALSTINNDPNKLKAGYREVLKFTMFFITPIVAFVIINPKIVILVIFGSKWLQSAQYLRVWTLVGWFVCIYSVFTNIFKVSGNSKKLLIISLIRQSLRIISIIVLSNESIFAILIGILITTMISSIFYIVEGGRIIELKVHEICNDIWKIILASVISASISLFIGKFMNIFPVLLVFFVQIVLVILLYSLILKLLKEDALPYLANLFMNMFRMRKEAK